MALSARYKLLSDLLRNHWSVSSGAIVDDKVDANLTIDSCQDQLNRVFDHFGIQHSVDQFINGFDESSDLRIVPWSKSRRSTRHIDHSPFRSEGLDGDHGIGKL
jgi:hypothetical protein